MKRYDIEMNGDDMLTEEAPDGRWVEADEALAELQKERNRRVEHVQVNKGLNEANQRLEKRLRWSERPEVHKRGCICVRCEDEAWLLNAIVSDGCAFLSREFQERRERLILERQKR